MDLIKKTFFQQFSIGRRPGKDGAEPVIILALDPEAKTVLELNPGEAIEMSNKLKLAAHGHTQASMGMCSVKGCTQQATTTKNSMQFCDQHAVKVKAA